MQISCGTIRTVDLTASKFSERSLKPMQCSQLFSFLIFQEKSSLTVLDFSGRISCDKAEFLLVLEPFLESCAEVWYPSFWPLTKLYSRKSFSNLCWDRKSIALVVDPTNLDFSGRIFSKPCWRLDIQCFSVDFSVDSTALDCSGKTSSKLFWGKTSLGTTQTPPQTLPAEWRRTSIRHSWQVVCYALIVCADSLLVSKGQQREMVFMTIPSYPRYGFFLSQFGRI